MKYATLTISTIVMHELLSGTGQVGTAQLSDAATDAPKADRAFIQERIRRTLSKDARPITEEPGLSPVSEMIKHYLLHGDGDTIAVSRALAKRLQSSQRGISPSGILVFADAELDKRPALLIAKLEHHEGMRATPTTLPDGHLTFGVELLKDLLITTGSKVFKVALFIGDEIIGDSLNGVLVDRQMAGSTVAQFFLTTFLGCRLAEQADLITERFYKGAQGYINSIPDAEKRARYEVALLSELQSQAHQLSIMDFAAQHLDVDDRDPFTSSLVGAGVPNRTFGKDNGLVKNRITKVKIDTEAGVTVLAPPETVESGVLSVADNRDETATITVKDKIIAFK